MEKYQQESVVGEGSYGVVLKCRHKDTGRIVAIKKFMETDEDQTVKKIAMREIRMLKRLRHENLINLIEVFRRRRKLFLVFEYVDHTVLDELEENPKGLTADNCRTRVFQVLRGIEFCHHNNIIHRDVKPENVLVSSMGIVKLCDFGFARLMAAPGEAYTDYVATRWYRAPELLVGDSQYGKEVDIWAIGCLYSEMRTGDPLFPGESDIDQLYLITQLLGPLSNRHRQIISRNPMLSGLNIQMENSSHKKGLETAYPDWSPESLGFLQECLAVEQSSRPDAGSLLTMSFFTHDNFHIMFPMQIRAKSQQEFGNGGGAHLFLESRKKGTTAASEKRRNNDDELARVQSRKELANHRKSETFDTLLGGGPGSAGSSSNGSRTLTLAQKLFNNSSGVSKPRTTPLLLQPRTTGFMNNNEPNELSSSNSISPVVSGGGNHFQLVQRKNDRNTKAANTPLSPGKLRRFEAFEQDLNKLGKRTTQSPYAKNLDFTNNWSHSKSPTVMVTKRKNNSGGGATAAAASANHAQNSDAFGGSDRRGDIKLSFESTFDQTFHIEDQHQQHHKFRPLQLQANKLPQNEQQQQQHSNFIKMPGLKKRRQTEPQQLSLPSVVGASSKLHSDLSVGNTVKTLPTARRKLGGGSNNVANTNFDPAEELNDENVISPRTAAAAARNLPYV